MELQEFLIFAQPLRTLPWAHEDGQNEVNGRLPPFINIHIINKRNFRPALLARQFRIIKMLTYPYYSEYHESLKGIEFK